MKIKCDVYRCARKSNTYLYLHAEHSLEDLPEGLSTLLGHLTRFLSLELDESTRLAQVASPQVLTALAERGYFLQMPPTGPTKSGVPDSGHLQ